MTAAERLCAYGRLHDFFKGRWTLESLVRFHTAHKLLLMAHSPDAYRRLGRLVADARRLSRSEMERVYSETFMTAIAATPTRRRHTNVLQHMAGYFKDRLDADSKADLLAAIDEYRRGRAARSLPIGLIRRHVRSHGVAYLAAQLYLRHAPDEGTRASATA